MLVELGLVVKDVAHLFHHEKAIRCLHLQLAGKQINEASYELSHCFLRWHCLDLTVARALAHLLKELAVEELRLLFSQRAGLCNDLRAEYTYDT